MQGASGARIATWLYPVSSLRNLATVNATQRLPVPRNALTAAKWHTRGHLSAIRAKIAPGFARRGVLGGKRRLCPAYLGEINFSSFVIAKDPDQRHSVPVDPRGGDAVDGQPGRQIVRLVRHVVQVSENVIGEEGPEVPVEAQQARFRGERSSTFHVRSV